MKNLLQKRWMLLLAFLFVGWSAMAQDWNQIIKACASDRAAGDAFGMSVAISGDYAIVGTSDEDEDASGGNILDHAGSAYIFKNIAGSWIQVQKIVASDRAAEDRFGYAVAISGDYAIVGAYQEDEDASGGNTFSNAGSAYIFKNNAGTWTQVQKIVASDRAASDNFGSSVAISGDYAIVGAYYEDEDASGGNTLSNAGSAYIFKNNAGAWTQVKKIVASDRAVDDYFGRSVSISGDYAIVGADGEDEDASGGNTLPYAGSAYIFKNNAGTWTQVQKIVASDRDFDDWFGNKVAISGEYAIVGAYGENYDASGSYIRYDAGSAYIFKNNAGSWTQVQKIVASDRDFGDWFGYSVAISGDYAIVGAFLESEDASGGNTLSNAGSAYIFKNNASSWTQVQKIVAADRTASDWFGRSVAISGDYAIVGAYKEDEDASGGNTLTDAGSAYIFKYSFIAPTTQASQITFTNVATTQMDIGWTNGNGSARVVFVKQANTGTGSPVNNTTYTASTTFASGTPILASGWYCVYNGTGTSVTLTGLTANTAYIAQVFEYNGTAGSEEYKTTTATNNPKTQTTASPPITVTGAHASSNGAYATLKLAFDAINAQNQSGKTIVVQISDNTTETATAALNAGVWTSLTIYPTASGKSITGNLATPLINLNGADNVTIDGRVNQIGADKDLTIINTSTSGVAGTSTIRFINDASSNTVKYCTLKGSKTNPAAGIVCFSTTNGATGNDSNTIDHNNITCASDANRPANAVHSFGTSTKDNSGNTISNNYIYDVFNATTESYGVFISSYSTDWNLTGNHFYETATVTPTSANHACIYVNNTSGNNFVIEGNVMGGANASHTGMMTFSAPTNHHLFGISLVVGATTASSVQNNTIKSIDYTNTGATGFYGIYVASGSVNIGTTLGNTIGSSTGTGSILSSGPYAMEKSTYGILVSSTGIVDIENNVIGSITASNQYSSGAGTHNFFGIVKGYVAGAFTASNNTIGSNTEANSIFVNSTSLSLVQEIVGIYCIGTGTNTISGNIIANMNNGTANITTSTAGRIQGIVTAIGTNTISNNTIHDLTIANANNTSSLANSSVIGICQTSTTPGQTISGNTIYNLSNTYASFTGNVIGLYYTGATTGTNAVSGNFIHSLSASSGSAALHGINIGGGTATYSNNIISLGNSITNGNTIYGIKLTPTGANTLNLYYNTVYIGGTVASGTTGSTYALSNISFNIRNYRNNIFNNSRSGGTTGKHYAVSVTSTANLTCDYNDYYAPDGVLGYLGSDRTTLADWQTATGQDVHSLNTNPSFASAGGTASTDYLPSATTLVAVTETGVTTDYAGATRSITTPAMGSIEYSVSSCTNPTSGGTIAEAQTICYNTSPAAFTSSAPPTGHTGTLEYKWQQSTTSSSGGFADIVPAATGSVYAPGTVTATTWYKRLSKVSCDATWPLAGESNVVEVTVNPVSVGGSVAGGTTVCSATNSTVLTLSGHTGDVGRWEYTLTDWTVPVSITNTTTVLTATNVAQTTKYRAVVQSGACNEVNSADATITYGTGGLRYVTLAGAGSKNGVDWANAYDNTQLQTAINETCVTEVWVASGTYKPTTEVGGTGDRFKTFQMKNGVAIYGGFAGTEATLSERDILNNPTVLSGDIGTTDVNSDNCYHLFYHPSALGLTNTAILDGFTISGGNANHSANSNYTDEHNFGGGIYNHSNSPTLRNCVFKHNSAINNAGAVYNLNNSNGTITNCTFENNSAEVNGGAINNNNSNPTLTNCLFIHNTSVTVGGAICIESNSTTTLTNCTFSLNGSSYGGGLYNSGGTLLINNSILWGNTSSQWGNEIETTSGISTVLNNSCFANVYGPSTWDVEGPITTTACINTNPGFVNPFADDLRIPGNSPCINSGLNAYNTELTDLRGKTRIQNTTIEMGAYEWTSGSDPAITNLFVKMDATGANNGTNWTDAFTSLQSALDKPAISGDKIWVATGTYYPSSNYGLDTGNDRYKHFRMIEGVSIYGSLAGTEDVTTYDLSLRDFDANKSVVNGDIGMVSDSTDNCYHIFYHPDGLGLTSAAVLDGFEITNAVANYDGDFKDGGGMFNTNNSPALANCSFVKNGASDRGGAMYNSNSDPALTRVMFDRNKAGADGGAVFNNENSNPVFKSVGFVQNQATYSGGGIYSKDNSSPQLINCVLAYNTAMYGGGAFSQSEASFTNCTFARNYAYQGGGLSNEADAVLNNCIVWGNTGVDGKQIFIKPSTTTTINYSDYSNLTDDISGLLTDSDCISSNPGFVDPAIGDLRIAGDSPCLDAGFNTYNIEALDIREEVRIQNSVIDMGAYEFTSGIDPDEDVPVSGVLSKIPNTASACFGTDLSATLTAGSGGNGADRTQYRTYDGTTWSSWINYTHPSTITSTSYAAVEIKTWRESDYIDDAAPNTVSWSINDLFTPGVITATGETICYNGDPAEIGSDTDASGGDGTISYAWYNSTNVFSDSTLVAGAGSATYNPPSGLTETTSYRRYAHDGTCNTSFEVSSGTWTVTVYGDFTPGTISSTGETICYNGDPAEISSDTDASGGDETISYAWYKSTNDFADSIFIATAESASYDPPSGLTETTSYRRYAHDGTCNTSFEVSTGTWTVTVYDAFTPGTISSTGESICYNMVPTVTIGSITPASGGHGTITYSWRSSADGYTNPIADANGASYTPDQPLTENTGYRRYATDATCNTSPEQSIGEWTVNVEVIPGTGTLTKSPDLVSVCDGDGVSATLTPGSGGNGTDELESRTRDGAGWSAWSPYISGSNIATTGKTEVEIRTRRMADFCTNAGYETVSWTVTEIPTLTVSVSIVATRAPGGQVKFTATPVNGGANPTYQWFKNGSEIPGATGPELISTCHSGDEHHVVLTSSIPCTQPATSGGMCTM